MTLGEMIAELVTPNGAVRGAQRAYQDALSQGAPQKVLDKLLKDVGKSLDDFNRAVRVKAAQLNQMGMYTLSSGSYGIHNQFGGMASSGLNMGGNMLQNSGGGPFGSAAGRVLIAFGALAFGAERLTKAFIDRAKEIGKYSPSIAAAEASSNIKFIMADIRESQALGQDMGRLMTASTDVQIQIRELLIPIKKTIINGLATMLELLNKGLEKIPKTDDLTTDIAKGLVWLGEKFGMDMKGVREELDKMREEQKRERLRKDAEMADGIHNTLIWNAFKDLLPALPDAVGRANEIGMNMGLEIPAFQGL